MSNSNQISIRQATTDELSQLVAFTHAIHIQETEQASPTHKNFLTNLTKWLSQELENPLSLYLVAEENTNSIGFIGGTTVINDNGFLENPTKGVINLLWVEKEHRRKKIAEQLVLNMEACFKENAISQIEVSYTTQNELASHFWKSMGFENYSVTGQKII